MSSLFTYLASGVYMQEEDYTGRARIFNSSTGGIVTASDRGPVEDMPTLTTSGDEWVRTFGKPNPSVSRAGYCALGFHEESSVLYTKRVVNGALYAGGHYVVENTSKTAGGKDRVKFIPFPAGTSAGVRGNGAGSLTLITLSDELVALNEISLTVTDGRSPVVVGPVVYSGSHNATMNALAAAITTAFASFGNNGSARVINEGPDKKNYTVVVFPPENATVIFENATITKGTTQPTIDVIEDAQILTFYAENPGAWGSNVGVRLVGFDVGVRQRYMLEINSALVTGNSFSVNINDTVIGPVAFSANSDTTLKAIAEAIEASPAVRSATVEEISGSVNNDRRILIVAENAGPSELNINNALVSGGTSQPAVYLRETLNGIASTNEFQLEVYDRSNVRTPSEKRLTVSMGKQVSANGRQTAIDLAVNNKSSGLKTVRVAVNEMHRNFKFPVKEVNGSYVLDQTINWLSGGENGFPVLNSQISAGWNSFRDRSRIPARLLINGGYTDPSVQQKMVRTAEDRFDAMAILDMPSDKQETMAAKAYREEEMNIDSSFGALYTPDFQIADEYSDELIWIPPSGHVAAAYAYSERTSSISRAPAGLVRGKLPQIRGLAVTYDQGDREILEPIGVNIVIDRDSVGPVIYSEETLQRRKSILSSVHARRLLNLLKVSYADELDYSTFDPNNSHTRFICKQVGENVLKPHKDDGGLYFYEIICDGRNNSNEQINAEEVHVWQVLQITPAAKKIILKSILTPVGGASFSETAEA